MDDRIQLTPVDRALARALDVDVSPDFAARVRQRVAAQTPRRPFWRIWRIAVPLAGAAAVAAAAFVLSIRVTRVPDVLVSRPVSIAMLHGRDAAPRMPRPSALPLHLVRAAAPRLPHVASEPEVLVPREQIEMYRRLIAAAQKAPASLLLDTKPVAVVETVVPDIQIEPLRIDPLNPPDGGKGDRQ